MHRNHAVNLARIQEIRPKESEDWERKLEPPINRVHPVSRGQINRLLKASDQRNRGMSFRREVAAIRGIAGGSVVRYADADVID